MEKTIEIPEGYEARIEGNKVILELKESEDEKIRKGLINYFNDFTLPTFGGLDPKKILAWLGKQGEEKEYNICDTCENRYSCISPCPVKLIGQNPADKVEPKFKVGDKIIEKDFDECGCGTIIDIRDGKYIFDNGGFICIEEQGLWQPVEQNPAWSEEDERVKQDIENLIHFALRDGSAVSPGADTTKEGALGWLKSLKERYTWKPSKEQIKAIEDSIQFLGCTKKVREDLKSLYNDLKKLKG